MQEFNKDGKTLGFIYKLKQNALWTEYFSDNDQTYSIKSHSDYFFWGDLFTLLFIYTGTRFLALLSLDELLILGYVEFIVLFYDLDCRILEF